MRNMVWIGFMAVALLSACGVPTAAGGASTAPDASAGINSLQGTTWQWIRLVDPTQEVTIDNPQNYTLSFAADNTVAIKADCNQASGSYEAGADGSLKITVGPSTLVGCPEGSRGGELLEQLGFVTRYFIRGEQLNLEMMADGGTLTFDPQ